MLFTPAAWLQLRRPLRLRLRLRLQRASDSDEVPIGQRGERLHSLRALPPGDPLVLAPTGNGAKRKRGDVSRALRPGGEEAPPIGAPTNVPSRGRPKQKRFKAHWER